MGLLGLFPIYLGLRGVLNFFKAENKAEELQQKEKKKLKTGFLTVATITFANGGDNIGTYIPLFATLTAYNKSIMITIFLVMVLIWLATAKYLTTHPILARVISKYSHILTPAVLILLGIYILKENGSFQLWNFTATHSF